MSYRRYYTPRRDSGERQQARNFDPTLQLERERVTNDLKLKGRFEHIFEKYARDFSDVGDEIDMETGDIVVDNGHITFMQHERDVGSSASAQFLRAFADELEEEQGGAENGDREEMGDGSEDDLAPEREDREEEDHGEEEEREEDSDSGDDEDYVQEDQEEQEEEEEDELSMDHNSNHAPSHTPAVEHHLGQEDHHQAAFIERYDPALVNGYDPTVVDYRHTRRSQSTTSSDQRDYEQNTSVMQSTEMSTGLPSISIERSLNALVPHQDASGRIDPVAIQDLGMSIANQIADFLVHATAGRLNPQPHLSRDPWSVPPLPRDTFAKHRSLQHDRHETPRQERLPSIMDSPGATSLWAPVPDTTRPHPNKRQKKTHPSVADHNIDRRLLPDGLPTTFNREETCSASGTESRESSEAPQFTRPRGPMRYSNGKKFEKDEDALLKRLRELDGLSWQQMTTYFPGKTPTALQSRYARAFKRLPRDIIVKREIVEILDGEDELDIADTPNWRVLSQENPHQMAASRIQPATPLLRRALGDRRNQRDETPNMLTDDGDDDDDEDDDDDDTDSIPQHSSYASAAPPGYAYPPGYYYPAPGQQPFQQYPYNAFPPPNGVWYPQMPPPPPHRVSSKGGKSKSKSKSKRKSNARPCQKKTEMHPRYTGFDSTQGDGRFGILRADQLTPYASTPQQHLLGHQHETTGAFGMLKIAKPKPGKLEQAMKNGKQASTRKDRPTTGEAMLDANPPRAPGASGALRLMPPPIATPFGFQGNDQANPHLIRDDSEAPSEPTPYPEAEQPVGNDGPYFLSNFPQPDANDSDDGLFVHSTTKSVPVQPIQESSPPLPILPSDGSVKFAQPASATSTGVAPQAPMVVQTEQTRPPPLGLAAKTQSSMYTSPRHLYASSHPATQNSRVPSSSVARKRVIPFEEEGSEDELA